MLDSPLYIKLILDGLWITIQVTLAGCGVAFVAAFAGGLAKLSPWRLLRWIAIGYAEFFRGSSALIQLFWAYYVLPFFGIVLETMTVGILILGLNVGAYASEVVRSAILAVPRDQREAAVALNLTPWQRLRHVVLPQALVIMLPSFGNNVIELLKLTSIVSLITINELTFQAQAIRSATGDTLLPYSIILLLYFVLAVTFTAPIRWLERRLTH